MCLELGVVLRFELGLGLGKVPRFSTLFKIQPSQMMEKVSSTMPYPAFELVRPKDSIVVKTPESTDLPPNEIPGGSTDSDGFTTMGSLRPLSSLTFFPDPNPHHNP